MRNVCLLLRLKLDSILLLWFFCMARGTLFEILFVGFPLVNANRANLNYETLWHSYTFSCLLGGHSMIMISFPVLLSERELARLLWFPSFLHIGSHSLLHLEKLLTRRCQLFWTFLLISKSSHYILLHNALFIPRLRLCSVLGDFIARRILLRGWALL